MRMPFQLYRKSHIVISRRVAIRYSMMERYATLRYSCESDVAINDMFRWLCVYFTCIGLDPITGTQIGFCYCSFGKIVCAPSLLPMWKGHIERNTYSRISKPTRVSTIWLRYKCRISKPSRGDRTSRLSGCWSLCDDPIAFAIRRKILIHIRSDLFNASYSKVITFILVVTSKWVAKNRRGERKKKGAIYMCSKVMPITGIALIPSLGLWHKKGNLCSAADLHPVGNILRIHIRF